MRGLRLIAAVALVLFGFAACSGDSDKKDEDITTATDVAGDDMVVPDDDTVAPDDDTVAPGEDVVEGDVAACEPPTVDPNYVGLQKCLSCHAGMHPEIVEAWENSGHNFKLNYVVDGNPPVYPDFATKWYSEDDFELLPNLGVTWNDVIYVIGGYGWKARFIGTDGYIITGDETNSGVQFNLDTQEYSSYHTGEQKPYTCGGCHTTGWVAAEADCPPDPAVPGFLGVYSDNTITCEGCHGPGKAHAEAGDKSLIADGKDSCANCHIRGGDMDIIPAKGGLTRHHEQYQEMLASPHKNIGCVACHGPHGSTKYDADAPGEGVHTGCATCHDEVVINAPHDGVATCTDCHMSKTTKSATSKTIGEGDDAVLYGDIAGHIFRINTEAGATLTSKDADDVETTNDSVPVIYACKKCHADKTLDEALEGAELIHGE